MGKAKRDIEEMSDDIYLAVKYHIPTPIMTRFLKALERGWESFMVPASWLEKTSFTQLHTVGLDCMAKPTKVFFGKEYYQLYKYKKK